MANGFPPYDLEAGFISPIVGPLAVFTEQTILLVGKLIIAYIIWIIGKWLLNLALNAVDVFDFKNLEIDDKARDIVKRILAPVAKVVLFLVILDTLGIGSNVIGSLINGLALAFAITIGLAFGRALEPDALRVVGYFRESFRKK